ncbi:MAG: cytochrome c [Aggregatilineales bacterium]
MKQKYLFANITVVMIFTLFAVAACGTVATPPPSSEELTAIAAEEEAHNAEEAAQSEDGEESETVAEVATETPVPPTETPVLPTATPTEDLPTATPTDEPTAAPASSASNDPLVRLVQLTGNAERGQELFNTVYDNTSTGPYACATCHSIEPEVRLIGPSQWNIREHAETRVEGESWAQYIYNSIVMPNAYIVEADPPYAENLMPNNYSDLLSDQDIYNLIAYLATLTDSE